MPGRGPAPKPNDQRAGRHPRKRGDWVPAPGWGWQHGDIPEPPEGLLASSQQAWFTWMSSWFAAHWREDDLPALEVVVLLYDQVRRGEYQRASELRLQMNLYGITPEGQQDRRWERPTEEPDDAADWELRVVDAV